MIARFEVSRAEGEITPPGSKSISHRLLIGAALCPKVSTVRGISLCDDVAATVEALRELGAKIEIEGTSATVTGISAPKFRAASTIRCHDSASTLRFLIPIAALSDDKTFFERSERLAKRPLTEYERIFAEKGATFINGSTLSVKGPLTHGTYRLSGAVSSQFISGLLFALPLMKDDSKIIIEPPFESRPYVDMTLSVLHIFGIRAEFEDESTLFVPGNQEFSPVDTTVETDYSGAAFFDALSVLGSDVKVTGLSESSLQGDRIYKSIYSLFDTPYPRVSVQDVPDLCPILMTLAAAKSGIVLEGTARLKIKESNRAEAMADELNALGAEVIVKENEITVHPCRVFKRNATLKGHKDHRIVMALSVLLTTVGGEIDDAESVSKSYPSFFDDLMSLGIKVELYQR